VSSRGSVVDSSIASVCMLVECGGVSPYAGAIDAGLIGGVCVIVDTVECCCCVGLNRDEGVSTDAVDCCCCVGLNRDGGVSTDAVDCCCCCWVVVIMTAIENTGYLSTRFG
jgi:hypothetical protein